MALEDLGGTAAPLTASAWDAPGPDVRLGGWRHVSGFRACGSLGFVLGVALAVAVALRADRSVAIIAAVAALSALVFLAVAMAHKLVTGHETLVYYHHQIAVMGAAAALLGALGEPPLPYLDATVLGIGASLVCGRVGCTLAGCCHGRPWRTGTRYGEDHVPVGFPAALAGVPLVPVQLFEAAWALVAVGAGGLAVATGAPPGTGLTRYVVTYAAGRALLEVARGDGSRPVWRGLSEAQWTSVALLATMAGLGAAGVLPTQPGASRRSASRSPRSSPWDWSGGGAGAWAVLDARHAAEIAQAVRRASAAPLSVQRTSRGLLVSASAGHLAVSLPDGTLSHCAAGALARLLSRFQPLDGPVEWSRSPAGVVHIWAGPGRGARATRGLPRPRPSAQAAWAGTWASSQASNVGPASVASGPGRKAPEA